MKPIYLKCSTCGDTTHDINAVFCFKCTTETLEPIYKNPTPPDEQIKAIAPITDKHAFHRITGIASPDGDVVGVQVARDLECQLNTQKELTECAEKNLYDLVALLSGKTPETYNARVKEIADGFLKRITESRQPLQKELDKAKKEHLRLHKWSQEWEQQVSTLRTELTKLKQQLDDAKAQERAAQKGARINALVNQESAKTINLLRQQLAEAVKDTQKLDWLEQYLIAGNDLRIFASDNPTSTIESRGDTGIIIRTAISAAMNNPTKEEK